MPQEKKKYIRGNNKPFMTKTLSRSILEKTRLRNRYLKNLTDENRLTFTRQWNSFLRKEKKKQYFAKLNEKNITDDGKFWHGVKQLLLERNKSREKITLLKNEEIISDEMEVANTLNTFFSNNDHYLPHSLSRHPTLSTILKYKDHPSIRVIKRVSQRF